MKKPERGYQQSDDRAYHPKDSCSYVSYDFVADS